MLTPSSGLEIKKAEVVNLLEDHVHDLKLHGAAKDHSVKLDFRGYEIKTVRLTVVPEKKRRDSESCWVKV